MTLNDTSAYCYNADLLGPTLTEMCSTSAFFVFMSIMDSFLRRTNNVSGVCERVKPIEILDDEYDYIVVGGGAAGAVVAARLSEVTEWKVLLLEAGPDEPIGAEVPGFQSAVAQSNLNWGYKTTNESFACLSSNGSCNCYAAKTLGGSTVHNGMIYLRGNPTDYNNWAAEGNEGWTWEEVEPFFLKSEDNGEIERVGSVYHTTGGPLSVERFPYHPPMSDSIMEAAAEAGFEVVEDLNGNTTTGFTITQATSKRGVRYSSARAFLRPARDRENLHISLNSSVTKVIIENGTAIGVQYLKDGKYNTVNASKEIILSAGTVESAHLLLLSGIGPKAHLQEMDIDVVKDLPGVGEHFGNHLAFEINFSVDEEDEYINNWAAAAEYLAFQTGPLAGIGTIHTIGVIASNATASDFPDIQISGASYTPECAPGDIGALRSSGKRSTPIFAGCLHPKSKGRVSLASKDPSTNPIIWGNYLSEFEDVTCLLDGIEIVLKLAETDALKAYNLTLIDPNEACSNYTFPSTEYWTCAIRFDTFASAHHVGTCKMGPANDSMAVVDPQLRVYGIQGLRVADASIMPEVLSANTAAPTMMIGERAADFIKNY